jgi:hypothetical protein
MRRPPTILGKIHDADVWAMTIPAVPQKLAKNAIYLVSR